LEAILPGIFGVAGAAIAGLGVCDERGETINPEARERVPRLEDCSSLRGDCDPLGLADGIYDD
jgi:hypothetical protein